MASLLWLVVAILILWWAVTMAGGLSSLVSTLVVGAIAGWLAGKFLRGRGFGVVRDIVLGIFGAVVGGILFRLAGFQQTGLVSSLVTATVGSVVVLYCVRWLTHG